jgi:flavin reductase (DIM6/NTAB) family NADH-FMN oxidoreductase RutF
VLTARDATRLHGTTVSAVAAVSLEPALLLICVQRDSRLLDIVRAAGGFALSYLASDQRSIATHFADPARIEGVAQFRGVPRIVGRLGAPIITGGPAWFDCHLCDEFAAADHQVVCGTVVAQGMTDTPPLQRLRGAWV